MRVINLTGYPDAEVRRLVRYGMRGLTVGKITVTIKPGRKHSKGIAYYTRRRGIVIWVAPANRFPRLGWKRHRGGVMNHDWQNWQEALVALAAHEGRHYDLWATRRRHESVQAEEMACEAWERHRLDAYRLEQAA